MRRIALSLLCVALVFPASVAADAILYLSPGRASVSTGESFEVAVLADSGDSKIAAAEAEISFDVASLAIEDIRIDDSMLATWSTRPEFSNETGRLRFAGWTGSNFLGTGGRLVTITFRALRNIPGEVEFVSGALLSADPIGSNILTSMRSGLYSVEPKKVPPPPASERAAEEDPQVLGAVSLPPPPVFTGFDESIRAGESIIVEGYAISDAVVHVHASKDGVSTDSTVKSGSDGSFMFDSGAVSEGVYRVWAEVEDEEGLRSASSEKIAITVQKRGYAALAAAAIAAMPVVLGVGAALLFIAFIIAYMLHRRTRRMFADRPEA